MASSRQSSGIASFFRRPSFHLVNPNDHADFEFQESDLYLDSTTSTSSSNKIPKVSKSRRMSAKVADASRSVPVSIPAWSPRQAESEGSDDGDDDNEGEKRVPPHEYLARRRGASLSVHEGVGRTLKGRDMSRVRDAVWKRIGFED